MKKNLVKKLALSAVTMGVAALTVTTTTFAWFTSNTSATASSIKATTVGAGEGNLLISTDAKNWATSATLDDHSATKLAPTQLKNGEFKELDGTTGNSANTVSYTLYFSVSNVAKGAKIQMNLSDLKFGADTEPTYEQKLLADAGADAKAGSKVSVKYGDVLAMRIADAALPEDATATAQENQPGTLFASGAKNYRYRAEDTSGADAVTYYNNILGKEISRPGANDTDYKFETTYLSTADSKIDIYQLGAEQDSAVFGLTFTFFIDGWDAQCFNAVSQGRISDGSFNFNVLKSGN